MTIDRCADLVNEYLGSLRSSFEVISDNDKCILITPFTRPDGDYVEIEAETLPDGSLRFSDMGESVAFLHVSGLKLSRTIIDDVRRVAKMNDVGVERYELEARSLPGESGEAIHNLIQTALAVADFIQRRRPTPRLGSGLRRLPICDPLGSR